VFNQSQGQGWGRGGRGVLGQSGIGEQRGYISDDKGHFHIPAGVVVRRRKKNKNIITHVTEEQFFFVKLERTLTYLALGILGGGAAMGVGEGWYGPGAGGG